MQLRRDICLGSLANLPVRSSGWLASKSAQLGLLKELGYQGVVHWGDWAPIHDAGLIPCGMASIVDTAAALDLAKHHRDAGLDFTTLHVGTGFESDAEMDALAAAVIEASAQTGHALHVETHRATMTQDIRRTVDLLTRFPELPLTLDFSHWYTGHEMTYGGQFAERLAACAAVFANVRSIQLRFGSTGAIQAPLDLAAPWFADHLAALDLCLADLAELDIAVSCAPELLPARTEGGRWIGYGCEPEQSDRLADAITLSSLAEARLALSRADRRDSLQGDSTQ